jgi:hypothetical protein
LPDFRMAMYYVVTEYCLEISVRPHDIE